MHQRVTESGKSLAENKIFSSVKTDNNKLLIETGSGNYIFEYPEEITDILDSNYPVRIKVILRGCKILHGPDFLRTVS